jgi:hypothetical protein
MRANIILEMATDMVHANLTYELLKDTDRLSLFPKELTSPEYLAKAIWFIGFFIQRNLEKFLIWLNYLEK